MGFRRDVKKVAVYGGGVIGSAWIVNFIMAGYPVTVYDINQEALAKTKKTVESTLSFFTREDVAVITEDEKHQKLSLVTYTDNVKTAVEDADFIQENGPEKLEIKQKIMETIEQFNTETLIASSTSGLKISDIAATVKHPERIVAGHPFNPVHLMPLVEVCPGNKTDPDAVQFAYEVYEKINKKPIILTTEVPGFIVNRVQTVLNREVQDLVARRICSVEDVDKAVVYGMGLRLGLFGPHMVLELAAGNGGLAEWFSKHGRSSNIINDVATWTERPEEYDPIAIEGIKEEFANRTPYEGQDHDSLITFRDLGIIDLLKYHKLL